MDYRALRDSNSESEWRVWEFTFLSVSQLMWMLAVMDHTGLTCSYIHNFDWVEWKDTKKKNQYGGRHMWQKEQGSNFRSSLLMESHNTCWTPAATSSDNTCQMPEKLNRDSTPRMSTEYWSYRHPLSDRYQHSRLLWGKQALTMNHIVCTVKA